MQSPFPGMDPYLEEPSRWRSIHHRLISSISDQLTEQLSSAYQVEIEERVYLVTLDEQSLQSIAPDVFVTRRPASLAHPAFASGITAPMLVEPLLDEEIREAYINIIYAQDLSVVTTIEVLSPANKAKESKGRAAFIQKRQSVLRSNTHWIEIDLLRVGERFPEVGQRSHYYALLKRAKQQTPFEVWQFDLQDIMPTIAVPLRSPDADAPLNLQAVLADVYQRGRYAEKLNYYGSIPAPRLSKIDAAWVQEQITKEYGN